MVMISFLRVRLVEDDLDLANLAPADLRHHEDVATGRGLPQVDHDVGLLLHLGAPLNVAQRWFRGPAVLVGAALLLCHLEDDDLELLREPL